MFPFQKKKTNPSGNKGWGHHCGRITVEIIVSWWYKWRLILIYQQKLNDRRRLLLNTNVFHHIRVKFTIQRKVVINFWWWSVKPLSLHRTFYCTKGHNTFLAWLSFHNLSLYTQYSWFKIIWLFYVKIFSSWWLALFS